MVLAIAGSGTGIWDRNAVTGEIHYSTGWKAMLGYAEHEVGNRIEESYRRVHPADLDYVKATIQAHFDQRTDAYEVEHRLRCRDGSYKWVCSRGKVVERDEAGNPLRMIGTTTDITAMRAMSEQVKQTAELMTDLTNEIPGMVLPVPP
ncbi:diguanylate cyclase [Pseudomonas sp. TCU-HL1]|nr:diguanylate cyclase [Pseudomonas sp. TCU-HL1]